MPENLSSIAASDILNDSIEGLAEIHHHIMDVERIPFAIAALLIAIVIGLITGPQFGNANPMLWGLIDKIFGPLCDKLYKKDRSVGDLAFRGFVLCVFVLLFVFVLGSGVEYALQHYPLYYVGEAVALSCLITAGTVWFSLLRLYFALAKTDQPITGAFLSIARTHRANLNASDDFGITRLGMGLAARTLDKGLVAPILWYLIGGLPVAFIYAGLSALCWRLGKDGTAKGIASVPFALERLMGIVPSIFTAALLTATSMFSPTAKVGKGLLAWMGMKNRATYEQGGFPLSVMAWSLNVSLGGAYQDLSGAPVKTGWVGPANATAKNNYTHLRRALIISAVSHALLLVTLACAYLWGSAV